MANMMANMTIWVTVTSCCLVWMLDSHHTCLPARAITYFFPLVFGYSCQRQGNNFIVKKCANSLNVVKVLMVLCELKTIPTHDSEQKTQSWFKACMFANSRNWKPSKEKKKINRGPKLRRGKGSRKSARGDLFVPARGDLFVPGLFCCPSLLAVAGLGTHARVQLGLASCWLSQVCPLCDSSSNDRKIQGQARAFPGYLPAAGASWGEELPWVPQEMFLCSITPPSIFPNSIQAQGVRN